MFHSTITASKMRHIIPFSFTDTNHSDLCDFDQLCSALDKSSDWKLSPVVNGEQDIYQYLTSSLTPVPNCKHNIGSSFLYQKKRDGRILDLSYYVESRRSWMHFSIREAGLYLFRTGIGFFWYEFDFNKNSMTSTCDLIPFVNTFKELNMLYRTRNIRLRKKVRFPLPDPSLIHDSSDFAPNTSSTFIPCMQNLHRESREVFLPSDWLLENLDTAITQRDANFQGKKRLYDYSVPSIFHDTKNKASNLCVTCDVYENFTMGSWIANLLADLPVRVTYMPSRKNDLTGRCNYVPDKALLFHYVLLGSSLDDHSLSDIAFHLTNGYGNTYFMNPETSGNMFFPFRGACWYATPEGCGYYIREQKENSTFFSSNMLTKVINDYFLLYILILHQSYTLIHYAECIENTLSADPNDYFNHPDVCMKTLDTLLTKINVFLVKSVNASVSHIHHQNMFYEYLQKQYRIHENIHSLTIGISSLEDIQRFLKQTQEEKEEKEIDERRQNESDRLSKGLGYISILAIFSAFADSWSMLDFYLPQSWRARFPHLFDFLYLILFLFIVSIIYKCYKIIRKHTKKKNQ